MLKFKNIRIPAPALVCLCAIFMALVDNIFLWQSLFKIIDITTWHNLGFGLGFFTILVGLFSAIFLSFTPGILLKPVLGILLMIAAAVSYFQNHYGVIFDPNMIQNIVETDVKEATELLSFSFLLHMAVFGLLPVLAVAFVKVSHQPFLKAAAIRLLYIAGALLIASVLIWVNYKSFVIIGREHREIRLLINPTAPLWASYNYLHDKYNLSIMNRPIQQIGLDAKQNKNYLLAEKKNNKKTIVILVVGETARAKSFSLNGYARLTNPQLAHDDVFSFKNTYSCGTSTAESLPCIFSHLGRKNYKSSTAGQYESMLDVIKRAGVQVLWRDNNSGCKGVCARIGMEDVSNLPVPALCNNEECFDEILLQQLQTRIEEAKTDTLVVLHQKGSHGPAYYKRYPKEFAKFTPECTDNAPQNCNQTALLNAYDNTIAYTDYFLHKTIELLKNAPDRYNTVMLYVSDHGESLGENGIYLHGLPYFLSPDEEIHIPMIAWFSEGYIKSDQLSKACLNKHLKTSYSHDNIPHTLLGLFKVETSLYKQDHDIFNGCIS
jgi:lipid A ethanolaminephosphotransferase